MHSRCPQGTRRSGSVQDGHRKNTGLRPAHPAQASEHKYWTSASLERSRPRPDQGAHSTGRNNDEGSLLWRCTRYAGSRGISEDDADRRFC